MIRLTACLIFCLGTCSIANAQPLIDQKVRDSLKWNDTNAANTISNVSVAASLALPCLINRTRECVKNEAINVSLAIGISQIVKVLVHRERPDKSEKVSFYSMHTTISCSALAQSKKFLQFSLCPSVAYERIAADKHWFTDTLVGGLTGSMIGELRW